MKRSIRVGALIAGLATTAIAIPLALPAGAAPKATVSCKKESSPPAAKTGGKVKTTISSCSPAALKAGGSSVTAVKGGQTSGSLTNTITWKGGKGTTISNVKVLPTTKGKCKAPYNARFTITGTVTKSTGAAKIVKKGEPVSAFICTSTAKATLGQSALEPGTTFKV